MKRDFIIIFRNFDMDCIRVGAESYLSMKNLVSEMSAQSEKPRPL